MFNQMNDAAGAASNKSMSTPNQPQLIVVPVGIITSDFADL